jgi:hypothetical protein
VQIASGPGWDVAILSFPKALEVAVKMFGLVWVIQAL